VEASLYSSAFPGKMPQFSASIAGHLGPCVRILVPSIEIARVLSPSGSMVLLLYLEVSSVVSLPLGTHLFIEVVTTLLHCYFHVDRGVV